MSSGLESLLAPQAAACSSFVLLHIQRLPKSSKHFLSNSIISLRLRPRHWDATKKPLQEFRAAMKQKIVIKVQMACDKCRSKAMALVAATCGVDSVALDGEGKDQVVVVGDGVDSIKLTSSLRRKIGPSQLVQVGEAKKEEKKPEEVAVIHPHPWYYHYPSQPAPVNVVYEYPAAGYGYGPYGYGSRADTCSIM